MASGNAGLSLIWRIHNVTCPAWRFRIGFLRKLEPGCRAVQKRMSG